MKFVLLSFLLITCENDCKVMEGWCLLQKGVNQYKRFEEESGFVSIVYELGEERNQLGDSFLFSKRYNENFGSIESFDIDLIKKTPSDRIAKFIVTYLFNEGSYSRSYSMFLKEKSPNRYIFILNPFSFYHNLIYNDILPEFIKICKNLFGIRKQLCFDYREMNFILRGYQRAKDAYLKLIKILNDLELRSYEVSFLVHHEILPSNPTKDQLLTAYNRLFDLHNVLCVLSRKYTTCECKKFRYEKIEDYSITISKYYFIEFPKESDDIELNGNFSICFVDKNQMKVTTNLIRHYFNKYSMCVSIFDLLRYKIQRI
ncbi:hypothetical protein NGRA_0337 [Nosema granulosis]|uniref:Uncharacterized protein n=1 Tax=Nosema granulosis TaxID=83296 RepID=A0A9P6L0N2_9MICR|nr:hypothetical protein NGRA_0337 [Nosema granulosis]